MPPVGVHTLVMLVIQTAYSDVVAIDSTVAMTIRLTAWIIILALMYFQSRKTKTTTVLKSM